MTLIGTYTEKDFTKKRKADEAKANEEGIKYFFPKFKRKRGKAIIELYGMTSEEYMKSSLL